MVRKLAIGVIVVMGLGAAAFWLVTTPWRGVVATFPVHGANLANGRTLLYAGGCPACHATPGQDDATKLGGGAAIKTAFGTFYAPNISPDPNDGIGRWSDVDFVSALTQGVSPSGQHYYPVFPYPSYRNMTLSDVEDLFAYLKTLAPVAGPSRAHDVRFPFSSRRIVGVWKLLFLGAPFRPDPSQSAAWNRGAYLVNGPGHCAECHSPRNILGGIKAGQRFAGGPDEEGEGWVPNITQKELGDWSAKDIAYMLETGDTPDGDSVGGSMAKVVKNTAQLTSADRDAIATYIKSLPPVEGPPKPPKKKSE
jgi:mono/diheme cytochrome c family protein